MNAALMLRHCFLLPALYLAAGCAEQREPKQELSSGKAPPVDGRLFTQLPSSYTGVRFTNRVEDTPDLNVFTLFVNTSLKLTTSSNDCMAGSAVTETHWAGGPLGCGSFGLAGKVTINPIGPDQIDMGCRLATDGGGGVTVAGTLTMKH